MNNEDRDWLREQAYDRIIELQGLIEGEGCQDTCDLYLQEMEELYAQYPDIGR